MADVALKGKKDGYEIILKDTANYDVIRQELEKLLKSGQSDSQANNHPEIEVTVHTGNRLLTAEQETEVRDLIAKYSHFKLTEIVSLVVDPSELVASFNQERIHVISNVIRNGQEIFVAGDVLFIGRVQQGGLLKATGNIFTIGEVNGTIHAGFPDHNESIIVGDLHLAQQIRISDVIDIVDDDKYIFNPHSLTYIDDLHMLAYSELQELKDLKPKLFHKLEER